MASADEDSDEYDYIDDPIKLFDFEQKRVDDCNNNSEDFLAALRKSALNNRPLVQIVDCKKFPWYYKRYTSRHTVSISEIIDLDDDDDDDVIIVDDDYCNIQVSEPVTLVSAESNSTIVEQIESISTNADRIDSDSNNVDQTSKNIAQEMPATPTKPRIRPVNIADYNLGSAKGFVERDKHLSPKTIPSKDKEKHTVKPTRKVTSSLIDFKKNLVVGLKIVNKVATVASKSRSKIKDLFGDDDDIEIPIKDEKNKVKQENEEKNKNVSKNDTNSLIGTNILPFKGDAIKVNEIQKNTTKLDSVTSRQVTGVGSPDRICNKLLVGSKLSSHSTSIKEKHNSVSPKSDSNYKSDDKIDDSAIEINNASLKFTITRKNTDEYCLSINNNEEHKKSKKKDKTHKKHGDKTKSTTDKKSPKGNDVSSRDKIKFKRDKKHKKDSTKSKDDKSYKTHKCKSVEKESNDITKDFEKKTLDSREDHGATKDFEKKTLDSREDHGALLAKSNKLNGVKYIVHSSKQEVNVVNPDKILPIDKPQKTTYLNEKVVNDVLRLQRYVDEYVNPEINVSKPTEITHETVIARSNSGTPIQASITISYSETPRQLTTTPEQPKHVILGSNYETGLAGSGSQQKFQEMTSPVVQSTFIVDPKMTSKVSSPKNDQRSEQTSRLFKERPLQAKHKSNCQTNQTKSPNISKTPPPLCNVEPLKKSIDGSSKPFSSPNCKDLSMPSLSPDPEIEMPMNDTDIDTNVNNVVKNQPVEKTIDQNDKKCKPKKGKDAKRRNSTVQNKKEEPTQIVKAMISMLYDASSAKNVQKQKKQKINKTPTASTTTVSGKQQIQTDNTKELKKMKNSTQLPIQELGHGPVKNDTVSLNLPNYLPQNTAPVLQDLSSQNVQQTERLSPIPPLINKNNTNCGQIQNRYHLQYTYNNYFHNGFGPRGPGNLHMFQGSRMNRAPPPWRYKYMEPRQRYPARMPQQMSYMPPNSPAYRQYNGPMSTEMMPRMPMSRPCNTPMPQPCNTPMSTSGPYNTSMPTEMMPPMIKSRQCDTPMPTQMMLPTSQPCNTAMPPMSTSQQPYSTLMPTQNHMMSPMPADMMPHVPTSQPCNTLIPTQNQMMPTSQPSLSPMSPMPIPTSGPYNDQMPNGMMPPIPTSRPRITPMPPMSNSRPFNTPMPTEMMPPTSQPCSPMEKDFMPPLPTSRPCYTPMPPMSNSRPCNTPMPTDMMPPTSQPCSPMEKDFMPPLPTSRPCYTPMPPMSNSRPCNTPMPTEMMPPTSQPCFPMEKDFMPPLPTSRHGNTPMPPTLNSRQCNTPMPTQIMSQMTTTPDLPCWVSELPPMPTRPCDKPSMPSYMMPPLPQQSPTSNSQMPSNTIPPMSRPQPPFTPMSSNMPTPRPPSTSMPSDMNSSIRAKAWNIPPASKYVRCSPVYETPSLNLYYPPSYEQNSSTNQLWPYIPPLPQGPEPNGLTPPPPPPASTPPQRSNNQMPLNNSSKDDSIIGRNPDDGNLIRKIALSKPNSSAVVNYLNGVSPTPRTPPVSIPDISSVTVSGESALPKPNESSTRPVVVSPKPNNETQESDTPVNDKSQMLVELCKAVGIEESPIITTPNKEPTKRPADLASLHPTLAHRLIPKKRKLSSSIATESQNKSKNVPVSQCGYSPPILPIPTHEKTFELLSQTRLFSENKSMDDCLKAMESSEKVSDDQIHTCKDNTISETRIETPVNRNEDMNGKDNSVRKISLDEYKKRVPNKNDDTLMTAQTEIKSECLSPNCNQDGAIGAIRQSTESDLGYDSDSTVRL